ncbi:hypothetical protein TRFO_40055 [Tritrichomonas foetus]|uniref:Uncharacterized protein n=1 Tax=Tritrichomonas foetus TaxID=1144522 RepID=A0A1J4J7R0_9EUKA|nr:hypothetical protein TRFO_40055 [Tritrichomonas foetus]|eukprot:OHS93691.1 hypothetical protein TRFO_40055 [Tritrichomonas foetus]
MHLKRITFWLIFFQLPIQKSIYTSFKKFNLINRYFTQSMEKQPKSIHFVSWKKHKLDRALTQVDNVCNNIFDGIIFETIIDHYREQYGYPGSLPVSSIIQSEPIIPPSPYKFYFETAALARTQKCPVCNENVDASRFTYHLATKCFRDTKDQKSIMKKYFTEEQAQNR